MKRRRSDETFSDRTFAHAGTVLLPADRLQPSVSMTSVVQPGAQESTYTANYRFTITNPNTAYSVKVRLGLTLTSAAGEKRTDFTFSPVIAPGDTVCFMYKKSYTGFHPTGCSLTSSTDYLTPEQVVRTSDLLILKPTETKKRLVFLYPFAGKSGSGSYSFQRGRFRSRSPPRISHVAQIFHRYFREVVLFRACFCAMTGV